MESLALLIPVIAISIPIVAIVTSHQRKLIEMKLQLQGQADEKVIDELREVKRQLSELRETTTTYDLSFDTALQRLESRIGSVEQRLNAVEKDVQSARMLKP